MAVGFSREDAVTPAPPPVALPEPVAPVAATLVEVLQPQLATSRVAVEATGAVAVGDDMLEPFLGGSILGKLSRRFGEGLVNGALTARVGVAAIEVCRPLPFTRAKRPSVRGIVKRSLTGLFGSAKDPDAPV